MTKSKSEFLVGRQIRIAANNAGMTLKTLAERLGVSKPTIYAYATGALHVPESRLRSIAEITDHDIEFFSSPSPDENQDLRSQLKIIDATLSPPDPRTASRLALAVIEREPDSDDALELAKLSFRAGNALLQHGDYLDAIQQLEHARRSFLNLGHVDYAANASQSLGFCYINLGRLEKAKDSFAYARDHLPPDQKWMGLIAMAALAERLGDFDQANRELTRLLQQKKLQSEPQAYVVANLATLHCYRTDWQGGLAPRGRKAHRQND
jgi:tetratricopeptide (TPR) repeat protein